MWKFCQPDFILPCLENGLLLKESLVRFIFIAEKKVSLGIDLALIFVL